MEMIEGVHVGVVPAPLERVLELLRALVRRFGIIVYCMQLLNRSIRDR